MTMSDSDEPGDLNWQQKIRLLQIVQTGRLLTEDEIVNLTNEEGAWLASVSVVYL
jgi:hypothetical protein